MILADDQVAEDAVAPDLGPLAGYYGGKLPVEAQIYVRDRIAAAGVTHADLARRAGISRPQATNFITSTFGLSPDAAARMVEVIAALPERQARLI